MNRVIALALLALALASCGSTQRVAPVSRTNASTPRGTAASGTDAIEAPVCGTNCPSPDGAWTVVDLDPLALRHQGPGGRRIRVARGVRDVTCAKPHTLLFAYQDYKGVLSFDPATGKRTPLAGWSDIVVSPDGRWVAGWDMNGGQAPESVGVASVDGTTGCDVPHGRYESDEAVGFTRDGKSVIVSRQEMLGGERGGQPRLLTYAISAHGPC